jgi:acetylornithine deacetylase/succinyl-diaminopimelate desuccinylase-like protein
VKAVGTSTVDRAYTWSLFERFVAADTSVLPMQTFVPPDDARVGLFAREVAAPVLRELGASVEIDRLHNVIARFGPPSGQELVLVSYQVTHHANRMHDPLRGRNEDGWWYGRGASQGKAGLAAACAALRAMLDGGRDLAGRVVLAVCSEGSSTHESSRVLYECLGPRPAAAVLTIGTENRLLLGNRGRVDVYVDLFGRATHSSVPELGDNPIPRVAEVVSRLDRVPIDATPHPQLGARHLVPYSVVCEPVAPHTIPERCRIKLDRRLLPGDSPEAAVHDVAEALAGVRAEVTMGPLMLPAITADDHPLVVGLREAAESATGRSLAPEYPAWTFDAGYPSSLGIPTLMFGPSYAGSTADDVLDDDRVLESMVMEAGNVYAAFATAFLRTGASPR